MIHVGLAAPREARGHSSRSTAAGCRMASYGGRRIPIIVVINMITGINDAKMSAARLDFHDGVSRDLILRRMRRGAVAFLSPVDSFDSIVVQPLETGRCGVFINIAVTAGNNSNLRMQGLHPGGVRTVAAPVVIDLVDFGPPLLERRTFRCRHTHSHPCH